jgi:hypothetical protein
VKNSSTFFFSDEDPATASPVYATAAHMNEQASRATAVEGGDYWAHYAKQYDLGRPAMRHVARVRAMSRGASAETAMRMYP